MKKTLLLIAVVCGYWMTSPAMAGMKEPGFKLASNFTMDPVVNVGAFWDSNVRGTSNHKESGFGWNVQPAISFGYSRKDSTVIGLNVFYSMERGFKSKDALDTDSYGEALSLSQAIGKKWRVFVSQSYSRSENDQFQPIFNNMNVGIVEKDKSENFALNGGLNYSPNDRWNFSLSGGWTRIHYLSGDKDTNDSYSGGLMVGRQLSEHLNWNTSVTTSLDDPEMGKKSQSYYLMTGLGGRMGAKTTWNAMAGVSLYDYDGYESKSSFDPTYSVSGAWQCSRKVALSLALNSSYKPEYNENAKAYYIWNHALTGAVNFQWSDALSSRLDASLNYEQHTNPGDYTNNGTAGKGLGDFDRTYYQVQASTYYAFNAYCSLYASISYRDDMYSKDEAGADSDSVRVNLGLSFRF
ncbi:MAG: hypothetical protein RR417_03505 [Kiritimatiellia bacterium]